MVQHASVRKDAVCIEQKMGPLVVFSFAKGIATTRDDGTSRFETSLAATKQDTKTPKPTSLKELLSRADSEWAGAELVAYMRVFAGEMPMECDLLEFISNIFKSWSQDSLDQLYAYVEQSMSFGCPQTPWNPENFHPWRRAWSYAVPLLLSGLSFCSATSRQRPWKATDRSAEGSPWSECWDDGRLWGMRWHSI